MKSIKANIVRRMKRKPRGTIYFTSDFSDMTSLASLRKILSRLVEEQKIVRVDRGMYTIPEHSKLLNRSVLPPVNKIVHEYAEQHGWKVFPSYGNILNMLGLSTQVPGKYSYLSTGPTKEISYRRNTVAFKKISLKVTEGFSYNLVILILAIKAIGKYNMNDMYRSKLVEYRSKNIKENITRKTKRLPDWIYIELKNIEKGNELHA